MLVSLSPQVFIRMFEGIMEKGLVWVLVSLSLRNIAKITRPWATGRHLFAFCHWGSAFPRKDRGLLLGGNKTKAESKVVSHRQVSLSGGRSQAFAQVLSSGFCSQQHGAQLWHRDRECPNLQTMECCEFRYSEGFNHLQSGGAQTDHQSHPAFWAVSLIFRLLD